MHRSRLSTLLIDTPTDQAAASAAFWSAALGVGAHPARGEPPFTGLEGGFGGLGAAVQAVDDAPRCHLDVETDDVEAETVRLLTLGAVEVSRWLECRTLRVPGGQLLCVIPVHSNPETFAALARTRP